MKKIELLNSEGPVLVASHHNSFSIDEEPNILLKFDGGKSYIVTENELLEYLAGDLILRDTHKNNSIYTSYPSSMKPPVEKIQEFLNYNK
jgi:hypothetical protein